MAGLLMAAVGGVMAAWWPSIPMLCVASVLVGTGYMLAHVAVNNAIGQQAPAEGLTRAFSVLAMGFSLVDQYQTGPCAGFDYQAFSIIPTNSVMSKPLLGEYGVCCVYGCCVRCSKFTVIF